MWVSSPFLPEHFCKISYFLRFLPPALWGRGGGSSRVFVRLAVAPWFTRDGARAFRDDLQRAPGQEVVLCWPRDNKTWREKAWRMEGCQGPGRWRRLEIRDMMPAGIRTREQTKTGGENQKWGRNQSKFSMSSVNTGPFNDVWAGIMNLTWIHRQTS